MVNYIVIATLVGATLTAPASHDIPALILAQADSVQVSNAWARASAGSATTGAAYVAVMGGAQPDQLVGTSTPVAAKAEVHESFTENGVMKMRPTLSLAIPPGKLVTLAPGGYHIMLTGLKQPLKADQTFPLTLTFAHAAPVTIDVHVEPLGQAAPMTDHMHTR